jgi:hypothetical protein
MIRILTSDVNEHGHAWVAGFSRLPRGETVTKRDFLQGTLDLLTATNGTSSSTADDLLPVTMVPGACNYPNLLVQPFRFELIRLAA